MMSLQIAPRAVLPLALLLAATASPAYAQEYWEYDTWEGETEFHQPTLGLETEYENDGEVDVEREGYEWEAGEGYHEEEWYDPSDWFDDDSTVDYEEDTYDYAYPYGYNYGFYDTYDYDEYDYDAYDYEPYDYYDYDYDYAYDDVYDEDVEYEFDQQVTGRVEGLQRIRGTNGAPQSVRLRLRTEGGETQTLHLGDLAYVSRYLPELSKGDEVVIGGETVQRNGKSMFQAKEMRAEEDSYLIPDYEYEKRVEGRLQELRKVRMQDGDVELVVARVKTSDGKTMDVRLGSPDDLQGISRTMRPDAKVRAEGYKRKVDGKSTFVVQDFKVLRESDRSTSSNGRNDGMQRRQSTNDSRS